MFGVLVETKLFGSPDEQDCGRIETESEETVDSAQVCLADDETSTDLNQQNRQRLGGELPDKISSKDQQQEHKQTQSIVHTCGADQS